MWKIVQLLIFAGVILSNVAWEWTPNPFLASLVAAGVAFLFTDLVGGLFWRRKGARAVGRKG